MMTKKIKMLVALVATLVVMVVGAAPAFAYGPNFDDQILQSGDIESENNISIEGDNNDQSVGLTQNYDTGNYANQQSFGDDDCYWVWLPWWGWYYWC